MPHPKPAVSRSKSRRASSPSALLVLPERTPKRSTSLNRGVELRRSVRETNDSTPIEASGRGQATGQAIQRQRSSARPGQLAPPGIRSGR